MHVHVLKCQNVYWMRGLRKDSIYDLFKIYRHVEIIKNVWQNFISLLYYSLWMCIVIIIYVDTMYFTVEFTIFYFKLVNLNLALS